MRTSRCFLAFWMVMAHVCFAQGDSKPPVPKPESDAIVFTNGDRLTGKLQSASNGNVVFHSDMAGDLTIPFSKVKELRSGSEFVALPTQRASSRAVKPGKYKPEGTGTVDFADDKLILTPNAAAGAGATPVTMATKDLGFLIDVPSYAKEVDHRASFKTGWTGSATAAFSLVRSTESSTTFTGALNFVRQIPTVPYLPLNHRTTINVAETYGSNTTSVIPPTIPATPPAVVQTSIFHGDAERDQYFSARFYALADTSFDHNFASGLQLQQVYGIGAGWTPFKDAKQQLDLKADAHYEKQQFLSTANTAPPANTELIGSTFQENYRRDLPMKVILTEWANIIPAWNDFVAYSANAYFGVALPLYKRLNISLSATDNYINNPAQYYRTNTVQYVTGVAYTFK